jgi:hypothetical protein
MARETLTPGITLGRADVIAAHGDTFNNGRDNCGHITLPSGDVVLLVTEQAHTYGTQGINGNGHYHWISQRSTTPESKKGRDILAAGSEGARRVHLWSRARKADVRFTYRGTLAYVSHHGEAPMSVQFRVNTGRDA